MMKILIIHQYYKTPEDGGAIRSYHIAQFLAEQGHEVSVITAHNNIDHGMQMHGKVKVHYLPVYYSNHLSFRSRILAFWRFLWRSIWLMFKLPKQDLHYVISTPLTTGIAGLIGKRWHNIPYIFEVGDLWPDAPIQLGVIKSGWLKRLTRSLERRIYNKAKHIVALSPDIKKIINQRTEQSVSVITNFSDISFFTPSKKPDEDIFKVGYLGTVGLANHLEYLIEVAEACREKKHIQFIVMGGGAQLEKIKTLAKALQLSNIRFEEPGDKEKVKSVMNELDAVYVSFKNIPVLATGSPNKYFDGLAAGKLIIINFEGWIKSEIEESPCGFYYDPERPGQFLQNLTPYLTNYKLLEQAQSTARKLAEKKYSIQSQLEKLSEILDSTV